MKSLTLVVLVLAAPSLADTPTDGVGRISIGGGLRWTPNWWFDGRATAAGSAPIHNGEAFRAPLGIQGAASFGYGAFEWFELSVDLLVGYESFELDGLLPFTSVSYGGLIGARVTRYDFPVAGLVPYLGAQAGPLLVTVNSTSRPAGETILPAFSVNGGASYKLTDRLGLFVDARWLLARVFVADIAGRNVGGVFFSVGLSIFFPPAPKHDLEVPGFGGGPTRL